MWYTKKYNRDADNISSRTRLRKTEVEDMRYLDRKEEEDDLEEEEDFILVEEDEGF